MLKMTLIVNKEDYFFLQMLLQSSNATKILTEGKEWNNMEKIKGTWNHSLKSEIFWVGVDFLNISMC